MNEKIQEIRERIINYREEVIAGSRTSILQGKFSARHSSKFYVFMAFLTVFGTFFFLTSRLMFSDDSPINDSGIGLESAVKIGDTQVEIYSKSYNQKTGYAEIIFTTTNEETNTSREYQSYVGEKKNNVALDSKLLHLFDDYYLLQVENIPRNWRTLVIDFGYVDEKIDLTKDVNITENKEPKNQQTVFYIDYRKIENDDNLAKKKSISYVAELTEKRIQEIISQRNSMLDLEEKLEDEITKVEKKIEENEGELPYQIGEDKEKLVQANEKLEKEKEKYRSAIEEYQKTREELEEKRLSLIERNKEATKK